MQYMLIHAIDPGTSLSQSQGACVQASLATWLEAAIGQRVDLHGSRLRPTTDATTLRARDGELLITDGPFAETKEQIVGYDVLECATAEEALEWAAKHPTATVGAVEVRPLVGDQPPAPLPAPAPGKTRYVLWICTGEDFHIDPQDAAEMGPATGSWVDEMDSRGARLFGSQLAGPDQARTVRVKDDRLLVTDGPFVETKEQVAGFDVLECTDLDEALEVAAKHPMAKYGMVELRPFWPFEEA